MKNCATEREGVKETVTSASGLSDLTKDASIYVSDCALRMWEETKGTLQGQECFCIGKLPLVNLSRRPLVSTSPADTHKTNGGFRIPNRSERQSTTSGIRMEPRDRTQNSQTTTPCQRC